MSQLRIMKDNGSLSASEYRSALLWLGAKDRSAILQELGQLSAADVRSLIGDGEPVGIYLYQYQGLWSWHKPIDGGL